MENQYFEAVNSNIRIGGSYLERLPADSIKEAQTRLCSRIHIGNHETILWFGVRTEQESSLTPGRADAFVMALLPLAMRQKLDITCEDPMSLRLHHQLTHDLIPAITYSGKLYHSIQIHAPLTSEQIPSSGVTAAGFSCSSELLSSACMNSGDDLFPVTHLAVFNSGEYANTDCRGEFQKVCNNCSCFAREHGFETLYVDSNLNELLNENYAEVAAYRKLACLLAIQGLVSVYLFSSSTDISDFALSEENSACYEHLAVSCACTESLQIYPVGMGEKKAEKSREEKLLLKAPYIMKIEDRVSLCTDVYLGDREDTVWIEVKEKYARFLADDRLDAFVAAFLYRAMTMGVDIVCEAPVSRRLLYQLNNYLIPVLADNIADFHRIRVIAEPTDIVYADKSAVGTGWTGGVDSMYTFMQMSKPELAGMRLTHLLITNNGALESDDNEELLRTMVERAESGFALENNLDVIGVNSNLDKVLCDETYLSVAGYRLPAIVLALQKLFSVFYNSACYEFSRFSFVPNDSAYYEMIIMPNLSTENTVFYSSGGAASRIQKLKELSEYPLAQRYLHPCIYISQTNCGMCGKCDRTITALYALGTLDRFGEVFDLEAFEKNKDRLLAEIISKKRDLHYGEAYLLLKKKGLLTKRALQIASSMNAARTIASKNRERLVALMAGKSS